MPHFCRIDTHPFPSVVSTLVGAGEGKKDAKDIAHAVKNGDKVIMHTLKKASSPSKLPSSGCRLSVTI